MCGRPLLASRYQFRHKKQNKLTIFDDQDDKLEREILPGYSAAFVPPLVPGTHWRLSVLPTPPALAATYSGQKRRSFAASASHSSGRIGSGYCFAVRQDQRSTHSSLP